MRLLLKDPPLTRAKTIRGWVQSSQAGSARQTPSLTERVRSASSHSSRSCLLCHSCLRSCHKQYFGSFQTYERFSYEQLSGTEPCCHLRIACIFILIYLCRIQLLSTLRTFHAVAGRLPNRHEFDQNIC